MAATAVSLEIDASADDVWRLIGGFGSLPDWLPFIPKVDLSEGGRVRTFSIPDGIAVERLEAFSNAERFYTYSIVRAPAPVTDYLSTIRVTESAPGKRCVVVWSSTFTPAGVPEADAVAFFEGLYNLGLASLKETLGV
jgi:hypothetical protein